MSGASPIFTKSFTAGSGGVTKRRFVKMGSADGQVVMADDDDEAIIGVGADLTVGAGKSADVHMLGIAEVEVGANGVTRGLPVTADATGAAEDGTAGTTAVTYVAGVALATGVQGDIVPVFLAPQAWAVSSA